MEFISTSYQGSYFLRQVEVTIDLSLKDLFCALPVNLPLKDVLCVSPQRRPEDGDPAAHRGVARPHCSRGTEVIFNTDILKSFQGAVRLGAQDSHLAGGQEGQAS